MEKSSVKDSFGVIGLFWHLPARIVIPPLLHFPFMTGKQCYSDGSCSSHPFHYDKWHYSPELGYGVVHDVEFPWAWAILDFWYWVMFHLAILGALLLLIRQYLLKEGLSEWLPSWIGGFGWAVAAFGVAVEWGLFMIIAIKQISSFSYYYQHSFPQLLFDRFGLNYILLFVHIACLLVLLLGAFPERAWRDITRWISQ